VFARQASVVLHRPLAVPLGERGAGRRVLDRAWGVTRPMNDASLLFTAAAHYHERAAQIAQHDMITWLHRS
jgi:hypothetical protein